MNSAEALAAIAKKGMPTHEKYEFLRMLHQLCVGNERKGRFQYWTFADGSTIRAYGYGLNLYYKAMEAEK